MERSIMRVPENAKQQFRDQVSDLTVDWEKITIKVMLKEHNLIN
jgi:hypothetical protein